MRGAWLVPLALLTSCVGAQAGAAAAGALGVLLSLRESGVITSEQFQVLAAALGGGGWGPAITVGVGAVATAVLQHTRAKRAIRKSEAAAIAHVMAMRGPTEAQRQAARQRTQETQTA